MQDYADYIQKKKKQYGDKFDSSDLAPQFIDALESGERIRVKVHGAIKTGTVGVTTGWKPCFLLMARCNSMGSSVLLTADVQFTTEKLARQEKGI